MKNKEYIKKYRLDAVTMFPHDRFAMDWGNDFLSRLEVWREFGVWNEDTYWRLYDEMRKKWEMLDLKCKVPLPENLWYYMRKEIFIPQLEVEFPQIAEDKDFVDRALIPDLIDFVSEKTGDMIGYWTASEVAFEWNHHYNPNAIGALEYKPNAAWHKFNNAVERINKHSLYYAFDELTYQLKRKAAAKAQVQFKIRKEEEDRRKKFGNGGRFDWWQFIMNGKISFGRVDMNDYAAYFELLRVPHSEKIAEGDVKEAFRKLSMQHHPDKGGSREKFEEIVEAKNKCIEYIKLSAN